MSPGPARRVGARLLSDAALARRAQQGSRSALTEIYARYGDDLFRFCLATLRDRQEAEDAVQNTMVKVVRSLPGESREIQLKPWLYRIAHNEAIEIVRRRRPAAAPIEAAAPESVSETAEQRERLAKLFDDLGELADRQRAALLMRELGGLGFAQVAAAIGGSEGAARQVVYEARLALREIAAGREMSCDSVARTLSDNDGRVARRRDLRAHLRVCPECRALAAGMTDRRRDLAAISPLPAGAAAAILQGALGAGAGGLAAGTLVKSAATVAVVATIGATAADRGGLVEIAPRPAEDPAPRVVAPSPSGAETGGERGHGAVASGREANGAPRGRQAVSARRAALRAATQTTATPPAAAQPPLDSAAKPGARATPASRSRSADAATRGRSASHRNPPAAAKGRAVAESRRPAYRGPSASAGRGGSTPPVRGPAPPAGRGQAPPAGRTTPPPRPASPEARPAAPAPAAKSAPEKAVGGATNQPDSP